MLIKKLSAIAIGTLLCYQHLLASDPIVYQGFYSAPKEDTLTKKNLALPIITSEQINFKQRLDSLQNQVPLSHNPFVQSFIDVYTSPRYRNHLAKMVGLSKYYFPIFEKAFAEVGFPDEIKYLSIVESALNPHAVSRVGATGAWQFMFATARMFNLNMDNYVDERKDPVAASYAAAAYIQDAYNEFGDWQLAIASYNCGKGNVNRAIQRSGLENPDFWEIMPYLPKETRNYVPAFIAMTYVMHHIEELGIESLDPGLALATEVIAVQRYVPLTNIAQALNIDPNTLVQLNPAYKKQIVNGSPENPKRLIVPAVDKTSYEALYAVLNHIEQPDASEMQVLAASNSDAKPIHHRVQKGESLAMIANVYKVEVQDLKVWNNLKGNTIVPGQRLAISHPLNNSSSVAKAVNSKKTAGTTYRVKRGDTLSGIANKHKGVSVGKIKALNNIKGNKIDVGMSLRLD